MRFSIFYIDFFELFFRFFVVSVAEGVRGNTNEARLALHLIYNA